MNNYIHPLQQHQLQHTKTSSKQVVHKPFEAVLKEASTVKISKHAEFRLRERNIEISESKWKEIESKIFEAKVKGVTDALVVLDDAALVVSAKNNTVVTALNKAETTNKIFTNINGTIVL